MKDFLMYSILAAILGIAIGLAVVDIAGEVSKAFVFINMAREIAK